MAAWSIKIETSAAPLEVIASPLRDLSRGAQREALSGLRDGGRKLLTIERQTLTQQMGTKGYRVIVPHTKGYLDAGASQYVIEGRGRGLPIEQFKGLKVSKPRGAQPRDSLGRFTERHDSAKGGVTAKPWNVEHRFKRSYVGRWGQPVARRSSGEVRKLFGPSPAKEIVKGDALVAFHDGVAQVIAPAVMVRIARLMG